CRCPRPGRPAAPARLDRRRTLSGTRPGPPPARPRPGSPWWRPARGSSAQPATRAHGRPPASAFLPLPARPALQLVVVAYGKITGATPQDQGLREVGRHRPGACRAVHRAAPTIAGVQRLGVRFVPPE